MSATTTNTDSFKRAFNEQLNALNERREAQKMPPLTHNDVAQIIIFDKNVLDTTKKQMLSGFLNGRMDISSRYLRMMRKLFQCRIDDFFPLVDDIEELPSISHLYQ